MINYNLDILKQTIRNSTEVAAAYLFGSAATGEPVVNDLDLLVLIYPAIDKNIAYFDLLYRISKSMDIPVDQVDLLFFDLQEADPSILYEAVNKGILIKNESPDMLSEMIDKLSLYFMENEFMIKHAAQLKRERLEEFCADKS